MGKILFWVVLIIAVLTVVRVLARHKENGRLAEGLPNKPSAKNQTESMVRCEHCGIHLPRSEATLIEGHTWCSQEHARLGSGQ